MRILFNAEEEIRCVFHSLVIKTSALKIKYPGGVRAYAEKYHSQLNRKLAVLCSMSTGGLDRAFEDIESHGLIELEDFTCFDASYNAVEPGVFAKYMEDVTREVEFSADWLKGYIKDGGTMIYYQEYTSSYEFNIKPGGDLPKTPPDSTLLLCGVEWVWSPMHDRLDNYYISRIPNSKQWLLWRAYPDEHNKWSYWIYCLSSLAFKSPYEAGKEMLRQAWSYDKSENMLDCYSMVTIEDILKRDDIEKIASQIWDDKYLTRRNKPLARQWYE